MIDLSAFMQVMDALLCFFVFFPRVGNDYSKLIAYFCAIIRIIISKLK